MRMSHGHGLWLWMGLRLWLCLVAVAGPVAGLVAVTGPVACVTPKVLRFSKGLLGHLWLWRPCNRWNKSSFCDFVNFF